MRAAYEVHVVGGGHVEVFERRVENDALAAVELLQQAVERLALVEVHVEHEVGAIRVVLEVGFQLVTRSVPGFSGSGKNRSSCSCCLGS